MESAAALALEFSRGTLATVAVSFRAEYRTPLELVGETGVLRADDALNVERPITLELRRAGSVVETDEVSNRMAYARQVDAFAAAVEGKANFPVPGEEGWQNQEILDAAYRSLKSGKTEDVAQVQLDAGQSNTYGALVLRRLAKEPLWPARSPNAIPGPGPAQRLKSRGKPSCWTAPPSL